MLLLHGAHHVAQKSSTTGWPRRSVIRIHFPSTVRIENEGAGVAWSAWLAGAATKAKAAVRIAARCERSTECLAPESLRTSRRSRRPAEPAPGSLAQGL